MARASPPRSLVIPRPTTMERRIVMKSKVLMKLPYPRGSLGEGRRKERRDSGGYFDEVEVHLHVLKVGLSLGISIDPDIGDQGVGRKG
jgi:hypothetical protein